MKVAVGLISIVILVIFLMAVSYSSGNGKSVSWLTDRVDASGISLDSIVTSTPSDGMREVQPVSLNGPVDPVSPDWEREIQADHSTGREPRLTPASAPVYPTPSSIPFWYPEAMRPEPDSALEAASSICITTLVFILSMHSHDSVVRDYVNPDYTIGSANFIERDSNFGTVRRSQVEPLQEMFDHCGPFIDESVFNKLADDIGGPRLDPMAGIESDS